jgi:hypothetical protein
MQLVDKIERRRFVGREFLLFLWFESELFDATLQTKQHGAFGLWLERKLVLSQAKESTRITAPSPGLGREAKEALRRGQLPESAGIRIAYRDAETSFVLKAEQLALSGVKLNTVLDQDAEEEPTPLMLELQGKRARQHTPRPVDADDEVFYERMRLTEELEQLLTTLYRDFLELRLTAAWNDTVVPALRRFARGEPLDADAYRAKTPRLAADAASAPEPLAAQTPSEEKPRARPKRATAPEASEQAP